jgi:hypothetical protein
LSQLAQRCGCSSLASLHSSSMHPSSQARPTISEDANPAVVTIIFTRIIPHVIRWIRGHVNKIHHIADLLQRPATSIIPSLYSIGHPTS